VCMDVSLTQCAVLVGARWVDETTFEADRCQAEGDRKTRICQAHWVLSRWTELTLIHEETGTVVRICP
jgi:hypothetical protein